MPDFALGESLTVGPGTVSLSVATDSDVFDAVARDSPFPDRAIVLGRIGFTVPGGNPITLTAGGGTSQATFSLSGGLQALAGVYTTTADALAALALAETPGLALSLPAQHRLIVFRGQYDVHGAAKGSFPVGVVGSVTFGAEASQASTFAILHAVPPERGANTAIQEVIRSWRLPRQVSDADDLAAGTWLFTDVDGSLALSLGAKLGYDFSFVRQLNIGTLTGDVGLKIDAAISATLGFEVTGRYFVVVSRPDGSAHLRLQLFKQRKNGYSFGLNLAVGAQGQLPILPDESDDFIKAVFGVYGPQVVSGLQTLDKWTDPHVDVATLVAGLTTAKAFELLNDVTGIDPQVAFDAARARLVAALDVWDRLPDTLATTLWGLLGSDVDVAALRNALTALASPDDATQQGSLNTLLSDAGLPDSPIGKWLIALADRGLLALTQDLPALRTVAQNTLDILDGGVLRRLQAFIDQRLDLERVRLLTFQDLDSWLVGRLASVFDKVIDTTNIDEVRATINAVLAKRHELYDRARKILMDRYALAFAATYQQATATRALVDLTFDTAQPAALDVFRGILATGDLDRALVTPIAGVTLGTAVLTHELTRKSSVAVSLPFLDHRTDDAAKSLARLTVEEDGGRLLVYTLAATEEITVKNRLHATVSLALTPAVAGSTVRIHEDSTSPWSYALRYVKDDMRREELVAATRPFIETYLAELFHGGSDLSTWYTELDRTVETLVDNGPNEFGDVLASLELALPARSLSTWLKPRSDDERAQAARDVSLQVQASLAHYLPYHFFQDVRNLRPTAPVAALLVWAAIPPANASGDIYWDYRDPAVLNKFVWRPDTAARLAVALGYARARLLEADDHYYASFFTNTSSFQSMSLTTSGTLYLQATCALTAQIARRAQKALEDIDAFLRAAGNEPTRALSRLAGFGMDITTAFNTFLENTPYSSPAFRTSGTMMLFEATRALEPTLSARAVASMTLQVLKEQRGYDMSTFLAGSMPPANEVAVTQKLVTPLG